MPTGSPLTLAPEGRKLKIAPGPCRQMPPESGEPLKASAVARGDPEVAEQALAPALPIDSPLLGDGGYR